MVIRPVVAYSSETWLLKLEDMKNCGVFERKILRTMYGPDWDERRGGCLLYTSIVIVKCSLN